MVNSEDKAAIEAITVAMPKQLTIFEMAADQVRDQRSVDTAIGVQLDKIGGIVEPAS